MGMYWIGVDMFVLDWLGLCINPQPQTGAAEGEVRLSETQTVTGHCQSKSVIRK